MKAQPPHSLLLCASITVDQQPVPSPTTATLPHLPGGNAEKSGAVRLNDAIAACSAVVLKAGKEGAYEREGHGARPFENWDRC